MSRKCVQCGGIIADEAEFCSQCGSKQPYQRICKNCGAVLLGEALFCKECGQRVDEGYAVEVLPPEEGSSHSFKGKVALNSQGNKKVLAVAAVSLVVVLIVVFAVMHMGKQSNTLTTGTDQAVISVKAGDMLDDYIRDQLTAEQKYKNKNIHITGTVVFKGQFKNTQNYRITLLSKEATGRVYNIQLDLGESNVKELNVLKLGDFVSAKGKCVGIVKQDDPTVVSVQIKTDKINE